ncbi:MAG TPA: Vms1/Ankzf1 family peptidyl-tRNA hydrolase [Vicinamibacteria bacterium]|nr:Vms1/Ankzf1 family peptidyl-tRNA hydrolase [Vicinamibacteria bacterium]
MTEQRVGADESLIDDALIERLVRLESKDLILSLCLRLEPRLMYERGLAALLLKSSFERFERREPSEAKIKAARRERPRVEAFIRDWTPSGKALVIYSCGPAGVWEVIPLEVMRPGFLIVDTTTNTRPLSVVLDEYPRLLVCVVQRDKASFYTSAQRHARPAGTIVSEVPGQHKTGGWSQARFERHTEVHFEQHLREVVAAIEKLHANNTNRGFDRLILGGTVEVTRETERLLPDHLRSRLVASLPVDVKHESEADILERARAASEEAEHREEEELVRTMGDRAEAGGPGVSGLDDTLGALAEGRIETLILAEDFAAPGWECRHCGRVTATTHDGCPVCGGIVEAVANVVDIAIERAFTHGARVEFVGGAAARQRLSRRGDIGALLRY